MHSPCAKANGGRLRALRNSMKSRKLSDGKGISGRGRLTDNEISKLQQYYGLAIRRNMNFVSDMFKAVWVIYFHKLSTDSVPQHLVYAQLVRILGAGLTKLNCWEKLMYSHGKTQKPNESFNHCIWERLPKTTFLSIESMKISVMDAVITFNDGAQSRIRVLEEIGIKPGHYMRKALRIIDNKMVCEAEIAIHKASKEARIRNKREKQNKKIWSNLNQLDYSAGLF
ncbi:uncharacterized protein TNCV_3892431 [Trichonephila clavipes]|nr:uncharacterized protein TNCV_3892431 [Trichonephila clavipes]